ncbi:MAG TPA: hypothetical protein DIU19_13020 [Alcanivorax sp.]|uniref:hypothetical protein n=1 Tax=Aurantimonas TaxID=182269 RepID=UPI0004121FE9|nr:MULTISPECIES: hypothetical protein [Aurantimonas]MAY28153.1 hypothetical protein [Aurantimonas sp.]HCQ36829.1 hypothetical protein [Alcanivorax sp.]MBC6715163.1 hypothetical protein [Aurantimonas sp. DM33-3]MCD1643726.1 hypothetical protein [Aurantimonas coralicida]MDE0922023.1 hypothetical protein [Aurantimonas coralicida]
MTVTASFTAALVLAAGLTIPFGEKSPPATAPAPLPEYGLAFEFVEEERGYTLNALVQDRATRKVESTTINRCDAIDIESFSEGLFGSPVRCDGVNYVFETEGTAIVVESSDTKPSRRVKILPPGHAILNGIPLLMETAR